MLRAFRELVHSKRYSEFNVSDIIRAADTSRSTFYEHFRNKDHLLSVSLEAILGPLAQCGFRSFERASVQGVLDHFLDVRELAQFFFKTPTYHVVVKELAARIEKEIETATDLVVDYHVPKEVLACQVAESMLGLIRAWLQHSPELSSSRIAEQLRGSVPAILNCRGRQ